MRRILLILLAGSLVSAADEAIQQFAKANLELTAKSYKKQAETESGNLLICGISAKTILSLLTQGAKGETESELRRTLSEDKNSLELYRQLTPKLYRNTEHLKLLSANKIYAAQGFEVSKNFEEIAGDPYRAGIQNVDFGDNFKTAGVINDWVAQHTNNKITDLLSTDQLNSNTRLVLVNTLYFSGNWVTPFRSELTRKLPFFTSATESREIDMMHNEENYRYRRCGFFKAQFLEMPFKDSNISMTFILPEARDGLPNLEEHMTDMLEKHDLKWEKVSVTIPKFIIRSTVDFIPILKSFGVQRLFSAEAADLSGISKDKGLYVDLVTQKTFISVTETGVEAAAATAVGISKLSALPQPATITFNADHPFLYYIREETSGIILFAGKFSN